MIISPITVRSLGVGGCFCLPRLCLSGAWDGTANTISQTQSLEMIPAFLLCQCASISLSWHLSFYQKQPSANTPASVISTASEIIANGSHQCAGRETETKESTELCNSCLHDTTSEEWQDMAEDSKPNSGNERSQFQRRCLQWELTQSMHSFQGDRFLRLDGELVNARCPPRVLKSMPPAVLWRWTKCIACHQFPKNKYRSVPAHYLKLSLQAFILPEHVQTLGKVINIDSHSV